MALLTLRDISIRFDGPQVLDQINFSIEPNERICLVGRNGEGKSTLLKIIRGTLPPDSGEINQPPGTKIAYLPQDVPQNVTGSLFEIIAKGLGNVGELLAEHQKLSVQLTNDDNSEAKANELLEDLDKIQRKIQTCDGWAYQQPVDEVLSKFNLDPNERFESLSGGMKRRVLLAKAFIAKPDILLLDEPTNHLDIEAILWLEKTLYNFSGSLLFITHDRGFLQKLATRIIDLDRGQLTSWQGDYRNYLDKKQGLIEAQEKENARFDKKLAQEEVWIRQGIKARRTRNEGRVRALKQLRRERGQRRNQSGQVNLQQHKLDQSGRAVFKIRNLTFAYPDKPIVKAFDCNIMRGDKIGLVGPNGIGKSTLLKLFLKQIEPDQGTVKHGTELKIAYFDQLRDTIDNDTSVQDNVGGGRESIMINDKPMHVISYLQKFLFSPDRARGPVHLLSGGERNRLLLAKLFTQPANLLILDEPTNDLDLETLELLEEMLTEYTGTMIVVSHDREFLNNVVTSTIAFDGPGDVYEYIGGYDDWLRQRRDITKKQTSGTKDNVLDSSTNAKQNNQSKNDNIKNQSTIAQQKEASTNTTKNSSGQTAKKVKLSFNEQRELNQLPQKMEDLEKEQSKLHTKMESPDFFKQDKDTIKETQDRLNEIDKELEHCFERWETLDSKG